MTAGPDDLAPELTTEVERQRGLIMRDTLFGDEQTRLTMERELEGQLAQSIRDDTPLRVYLGVDPTAPDLHLGHCVPLRKLRVFQQLGHTAILLIGDFTALLGDPSDKDAARPMQAATTITRNAQTYQDQAFTLLDPDLTEVRRNSEWLAKLNFGDVIQLASNFTVAQFAERDTFRKRLDKGEPVYLHEFMYGLMQGYDAVALEADIQIGGTDQTFNIMAGRTLQRVYEQPPQVAITFPILVGTDGTLRMSKTTGNYIGIDEPANEQYGKAMSIPDAILPNFFSLGTNVPSDEVDAITAQLESGALHPMDAKKRLAHAIVSEWHSPAEADAAAEYFANVFSQRQVPDDMPEHVLSFDGDTITIDLASLIADAGLAASRGEAKRLIGQGGVRLNDEVVAAGEVQVSPGAILRVGRRRWLRLVAE